MTEMQLDGVDDALIVARAVDGDTAAFAVLVRRYAPMMRAHTRRLLGGNADVDDIVQETFVVAWQRLDELDDPAAVRPWLMRIVSRRAMDRRRAARVHLDVDDVEHEAPVALSPPRIVEARARAAALDEVLAELPEAQRQCWVLRELAGQSYDEIAEELSIPASTVRGLLARARKYIIVRMEQWR
ncbi:RNA polymerase sigma-70 factor (ECF subfamily) [Microbacterium sp. ZKA21]|uniref:RNA polymerase sigma factor n=1 Tax=Microbacterium sp. ZKA21 TaxID=3381694 RepID=UPI003D234C7F